MEYGNDKQKAAFYDRVINSLKEQYEKDLNIIANNDMNNARDATKSFLEEIEKYENIIEGIKQDISEENNFINRFKWTVAFVLNIISLFALSLYGFAKFACPYSRQTYYAFFIPLYFLEKWADATVLFFREHFILTYLLTFLIIFGTYRYLANLKRKNALSVYIQWLIILATFVITGGHAIRLHNMHGFLHSCLESSWLAMDYYIALRCFPKKYWSLKYIISGRYFSIPYVGFHRF